jgi:outer membrane protein
MSRFIRTTVLAMAMLAPFSLAHAQGVKIAVVNVQSIMKDSAAAKSIREQLESKQKAYQADISKQEDALQKSKQELDKQQAALSKEAFAEKVKDFQGKVTDMQKQVQSKKMTLDAAYEQSIGQIQKTVGEIIADMSKEKGFQVAVPSGQLLFADPSLDITADVAKRLNEKMPSYTVKFEAPAAPKAPEKK